MARRRVKLYALNADRQWDDRGTGHVTSSYIDRLKGISLLVRAECDGSLLLESKIMPDTAYQKQQGTLIVWSEGENFDLALSFQEKGGCDEIWEQICQVQGKDPSVEMTQDIIEESEDERYEDVSDTDSWVELPPCELSRLEDINEAINNGLVAPVRREKLAIALENDGYIKKLIALFHTCEDLENLDGLHILYEIFKNIFHLNKNPIFEIMFHDDMIFDVIGVLEYDPSSSFPKRHRHYLKSIAKFKEVIGIENHDLLSKIHQTYRVQYIQDVVLPTPAVFEENMLSTLSSFIFFNKVEIVSLIQEDTTFLSELFHQLSSAEDDIPLDKRRDLVLFLKEFCTFSQTLQPMNRDQFFKSLSNFGVLPALEITLSLDDQVIKSASIDILNYIVEFCPSMVREYMMAQQNKVDEEQYLLNVILEQMVLDCDPDMGGAVQLMGMLRILIDPENMMSNVSKSERAEFLLFFYKHSMHALVAPLLANTAGDEIAREDTQMANLLAQILELLSFCVEHHTYHIKNYIIQRDLLKRILVLMKSKHSFLVLSALRFLRKIISLKDDFYNQHIVNSNLFAPVVDAFVRNNGRYNLLDSAIIELFEYVRMEDVQLLWINVIEKFGPILTKTDYVQTFHCLRLRYDQYQEKLKDRDKGTLPIDSLKGVVRGSALSGMTGLGVTAISGARFRRDVREMEVEQEMWFDNDEEEDLDEKTCSPKLGAEGVRNIRSSPPLTNSNSHKEPEIKSKITGGLVGSGDPVSIEPKYLMDHWFDDGEVSQSNNDSIQDENSTNDSEKSDTGNLNDASVNEDTLKVSKPNKSPPSPVLSRKKVSLVDYDESSDEEADDLTPEPTLEPAPAQTEPTLAQTEPTTELSPEPTNSSDSKLPTDKKLPIENRTLDTETITKAEPTTTNSTKSSNSISPEPQKSCLKTTTPNNFKPSSITCPELKNSCLKSVNNLAEPPKQPSEYSEIESTNLDQPTDSTNEKESPLNNDSERPLCSETSKNSEKVDHHVAKKIKLSTD